MKSIDLITRENFNEMFNLKNILEDSVFYPASAVDGTAIECLSNQFNSFVHVDYSTPNETVKRAMGNNFSPVGYDLIGLKLVERNEMTPNGFSPREFQPNEHERQRLQSDFIKQNFQGRFIQPFAYWAVYELNPDHTGSTKGKAERFSLLHIGGEACATFEAVYINNKINPGAVAIISPGEGYGDNWTIFRDPSFRLYQNMLYNHQTNGVPMPGKLLTNMIGTDEEPCFWPEYKFQERPYCNGGLRLYSL